MIRHHPSDTTLLAAAAEFLPEPHRRVLAVHLAACRLCAARHQTLRAVGGALLETLPPAPLAEDALQRTMARLHETPAATVAQPAPVTLAGLATGRWRSLGRGLARMTLIGRDETSSRLDLIRVAPGIPLPAHGHTAFETTVVLQGAFEDGGATFGIGDLAEADAEVDHSPRALAQEACICLVATTGRLHAHNWLLRLMQPLIRI